MSTAILSGQGLQKYFQTRRGVIRAVDGVDFEMREGEVLGVVGESGSGKTTLGNMIVGIYPPTSGKGFLRGVDISRGAGHRSLEIKREIQMVFQNPSSSLNPNRSVMPTLEDPLSVTGAPSSGGALVSA